MQQEACPPLQLIELAFHPSVRLTVVTRGHRVHHLPALDPLGNRLREEGLFPVSVQPTWPYSDHLVAGMDLGESG